MTDEHFTEVYRAFMADMYRLAFSYLRNPSDAENIVQDIFLRNYLSPPKNEESLKSYLMSSVRNGCLDELRRRKREKETFESMAHDPSMNQSEDGSRKAENLLLLIGRLPEKYGAVIRMRYYSDMSVKDISEALGITESNIKKRLERGKKMLKEMLEAKK